MAEEKKEKKVKVKKENFIKSVFTEMKLVTWPTGKQLRKDTVVVFETAILFAIFFAVADFAVSKALSLLILK